MASPASRLDAGVLIAMVGSGAVGAQFVAGKATRDALYLERLDVTSLPTMVMATAGFSLLVVAASTYALRRMPSRAFVTASYALSAALLLVSWAALGWWPQHAARAIYLLFSGIGPMLGSGFWLIATERFDPRTARRNFGRITAAGTLSGLGSALLAERVAATLGTEAMLPILAGLTLLSGWLIGRLARHGSGATPGEAPAASSLMLAPRSGFHVLATQPYLRNLAALVLLGTVAAALADYAFKVQATETLGRGDTLLRFFAWYYGGVSLLAFLLQTSVSRVILEKLGLGVAASTPSLALCAGGLAGLAFPGLWGVVAARGSESALRGSIFKAGYEVFYTPIPPADKRAAKSIIDVGFDRLGDAFGGGMVRLLILLPAARQYTVLIGAAIGCSLVAIVVARRLSQGYIQTLERSLLDRAVALDLTDVEDLTTKTVMMRTMSTASGAERTRRQVVPVGRPTTPTIDAVVQRILALRSRDRDAVVSVLRAEAGLSPVLVTHVIPLLAWDPVSEHAVAALRAVADRHVGALLDALLDPDQPFAVRRRMARVFATCTSRRAMDGVTDGLRDQRFEVRFQCGRSLAAMLRRTPELQADAERVFDAVRREVAVGRPVWESQRLLDAVETDERSFVDEFLRGRAGQSLAHVFTLLSLVLPTTPLQIAYRGLHTTDPGLRGTALEYLEGVLPHDIRDRLWPFLDDRPRRRPAGKPRDEILADLLRSNESIAMNLEELRRRDRQRVPQDAGDRKDPDDRTAPEDPGV